MYNYREGEKQMKNLTSYLITIFVVLFWIFRIAVALTQTMGIEIGIAVSNITYEIILLFITLLAIVLIIKRNLLGALIYFASYLMYFGQDAYNGITRIIEGSSVQSDYFSVFVAVFAIILSVSCLIDILLNKERTNDTIKKKTDWFYKNKDFDRNLDDRADKNNYRIL
jgi:hypothetical protein